MRDDLTDHQGESYVGETGASMKALELQSPKQSVWLRFFCKTGATAPNLVAGSYLPMALRRFMTLAAFLARNRFQLEPAVPRALSVKNAHSW